MHPSVYHHSNQLPSTSSNRRGRDVNHGEMISPSNNGSAEIVGSSYEFCFDVVESDFECCGSFDQTEKHYRHNQLSFCSQPVIPHSPYHSSEIERDHLVERTPPSRFLSFEKCETEQSYQNGAIEGTCHNWDQISCTNIQHNSTRFMKPSGNIPLPKSHIHRTRSELQLCEDSIAAEVRDTCMFNRLVSGIQEKSLEQKRNKCLSNGGVSERRTQKSLESIVRRRYEDIALAPSRVSSTTSIQEQHNQALNVDKRKFDCNVSEDLTGLDSTDQDEEVFSMDL